MTTPSSGGVEADAKEGNDFNARVGGDFSDLIARAKRAHNSEVKCLQQELQSLRERLALTCGDEQNSCADSPVKRDPPTLPVRIQSSKFASGFSEPGGRLLIRRIA